MTIKTIVTLVEPADAEKGTSALAAAFACGKALDAHVVVLAFEVEVVGPSAPSAEPEDLPEGDPLAAARSAILKRADEIGVSCAVADRSSYAYGIGDVFADQVKVADLGILPIAAPPSAAQRFLLHAALFDSGRPLLVVPETVASITMPKRVLVAWDASPAAARALHEAFPLIEQAEETIIATVSDDKAIRLGQSAIEATHLIARHGGRGTFRSVERRGRDVLDALLEAAHEAKADLIVSGAVRHSSLHDLMFGGVTRRVLDGEAKLPFFLSA